MKKVHFIGIGGIGMSALAQVFLARGFQVTGSDASPSEITDDLQEKGITITFEHTKENISEDVFLVVYTEAIDPSNPELVRARDVRTDVRSYFEVLGEISREYKTIAVAGTHGKTTTTALAALALIEGGKDPTVVVGTRMKEFSHNNMRIGKSPYLLVEACEYRESFLHLHPFIAVITNADLDHVDYYRDLSHYQEAFSKFVKRIDPEGYLFYDGSQEGLSQIIEHASCKHIVDVSQMDLERFENCLSVPGEYNMENARFAYFIAQILGCEDADIMRAFSTFSGTWRRFDIKIREDGLTVIDDYGHHPKEVSVTLKAARQKYPDKRIICVFQPHQYSRTYFFLDAFSRSFSDADMVIIPNIYEARDTEEDKNAISVSKLVSAISDVHPHVVDGKGLTHTLGVLENICRSDDVIILMGAGDVYELSGKLLS